MSGGSTNETGNVLGSATGVTAGAVLLPSTGGNEIATAIAIVAMIAGSAVISSALVKRIAIRLSK